MSGARRAAANVVGLVGGRMTSALVGLLTVSILTRHLGPEGFGEYRAVLTWCAGIAVLADCGLYLVTLRALADPAAAADNLVGRSLALRLASTGSLMLVACGLVGAFASSTTLRIGMVFGALVYTSQQASEFLLAVFQSRMRQTRAAAAEIVGALAALAGVVLLTRTAAGPLPMLAAVAGGAVLTLGLAWRMARRLVPLRLEIRLRTWKRLLREGLPIAGSQLLGMVMLRGDSLLLSVLQPASELGYYGVPAKLFELFSSLPWLYAGLTLSSLCEGTHGQANLQLRPRLVTVAIYGTALILVLVPFAPEWLRLLAGARFVAGAGSLRILALAAALAGIAHTLRFALAARQAASAALRADALACGVCVVAYLALIPVWSGRGAAVGTLLGEAIACLGLLRAWVRLTGGAPMSAALGKAVAAGCLAGAGLLALSYAGLVWPVALACGIVAYGGLLLLTGVVPLALARELLHLETPAPTRSA